MSDAVEVPVLTDGVVQLDAPSPDDAEAIVDPEDEAVRWAWFRREPTTVEQALRRVEHAAGAWRAVAEVRAWAIRLVGAPAFVGWLGLRLKPDGALAESGSRRRTAATASAGEP
jgi:hypothetical protein